jgi:serine/threonine-protein kinase HipA
MKICVITQQAFSGEGDYSKTGLKLLSPKLNGLKEFPFTQAEQIEEARERADKLSIQGVQTKLSARLSVKNESFEIVSKRGLYILKPQHEHYKNLPENEALTMQLARAAGFEVPLSGMVYAKDRKLVYFIKRFDSKNGQKVPQEDFAQLAQKTRQTKYSSSLEEVAQIVERFCTFPELEKPKLLKLILFNFLIGNEDAHLKNFTLITREEVTRLSPVYDLLNSTIVLNRASDELALPLKGKKTKLTKNDFLKYFAIERLKLEPMRIHEVVHELEQKVGAWPGLISSSFLTEEHKEAYLKLLNERANRLF